MCKLVWHQVVSCLSTWCLLDPQLGNRVSLDPVAEYGVPLLLHSQYDVDKKAENISK